ncbi:MAG: rane protein required for colicin production [Desulfonauticus sp.]|jgi:membrane protein required for colicin V production|nr:MAG: Colicin V production protein [Desulfonauticus sp. 38_4375]MDK2921820.1 rane protein required for colicin production [Desulfonauticus sp.]
MNFLDIFFLVVISFFFLRGIYRGLVQEVSSLVALFLGFFLANRYWQKVLPLMEEIIPSETWAKICSYLAVLIGVMFIIFIISTILKHLLKMAFLGWLDRIGGAAIGLLKALVLCSIFLMILTSFLPARSEALQTSKLAPYVHRSSLFLAKLLPKELKDRFEENKKTLERKWKQKLLPGIENE